MRVETFLRESANRFADKEAIVTTARRLTYSEFDNLSDRLALALMAKGVARNDRVFVFMDNCWEAAVSLFAIWKAGATASLLNPSVKSDKLAYMFEDCETRCVICQPKQAQVVAKAREDFKSPLLVVSTEDATGGRPEETESFSACLVHPISTSPVAQGGISTDLALLIYTSGTTGRPKGVMMTHQNVEAAAKSISTYLEKTPEDIILNALPMAFDYGLYQLIMSVLVGSTLVLEKSFAFPQAILNRIVEERVTGFPIVPTVAAMLLQMKSIKPGDYPSLRYISSTAAALPASHIKDLRHLYPGTTVYSMYGLTECKRCTYLPPDQLDSRADSVGIAIPNTEAFVLDDEGQDCAPSAIGELVIRGPHVMQGYWKKPEETNQMLKTGRNSWEKWLYTGDLFRKDEDGYLYFVGRKDDIIKSRGEKIAPKEIEEVLQAHPDIAEALIVGVPDDVLGQALHAFVVLRQSGLEGLSTKQIAKYCRDRLEDFMVPQKIEIRTDLPKTDNGKLSRRLISQSMDAAS